MKIKSKLILAATSLLVLSGVAAGTSTFAWFTANQAATITASQVNVKTNTDNLKITASAADFDDDSDATDSGAAFTTTRTLTDVSGNGVKLYRGSKTGADFTSSIAVVNFQAPYCFDFAITFSHTDITDGNALAIFLSSDSAISACSGDTSTSTLYGGARVALLNEKEDASLAYYAPNDNTADLKTILTEPDYSGPGTDIDYTSLDLSATHTQNILTKDSFTTDYNDSTVGAANAAIGYVGTIIGNESLTIHARIFLEGQDLDTSNENVGGSFDTSLIFNGVSENLGA